MDVMAVVRAMNLTRLTLNTSSVDLRKGNEPPLPPLFKLDAKEKK